MKKVKLDTRVEKALNAFFENENQNGDSAIMVAENHELAQTLPFIRFTQFADKYFNYFKKIFAFVPGVLFLHLAVPATLEFGFGLWGLFWLAAGTFLVWSGIGDLKNKKHFLLPVSVMLTALIFALPFGVLPASLIAYYIYLYIGILPLLFVTPVLIKGVIEKNEQNKN